MLCYAASSFTAQAIPFDNNSESVLLQGFYWDIYEDLPSGLAYWDVMRDKASQIKDFGFDMVWVPPATHSSGGMGYHPRQLNLLDGRFGSRDQLSAMINRYHELDLKVIADVVINHRQGETDCDANFQNPYFPTEWVVQNDEWQPGAWGCEVNGQTYVWEFSGSNNKSNTPDVGIAWAGARDLDHENPELRDAVRGWLSGVMGKGDGGVGFDGWRFDLAHGYRGKWAGEYTQMLDAYFSVGETWFAVDNPADPASVAWSRQQIVDWLDSAEGKSFAFDFTTKYLLNDVLGGFSKKDGQYHYNPPSYQFQRLATEDMRPAGVLGVWPGRAVSFVDNHDSGPGARCDFENSDGQAHLALDCHHLGQAYAYILTHPGLPTVYWPHIENSGDALKNEIRLLMAIRKEMGVNSGSDIAHSSIIIHRAEPNIYAATIRGTYGEIALQMGKPANSECGNACYWQPPGEGWQFRMAGLDYWIWTRTPEPEFDPTSLYSIRSKLNGKAIEVEGFSSELGANVQMWDWWGNENQRWAFVPEDDGSYALKNILSGLVLDVQDWSTYNSANILQWSYHGGENQRWKIEPAGAGYFSIINVHSEKALDIESFSLENGANLLQYDFLATDNQLWHIEKIH